MEKRSLRRVEEKTMESTWKNSLTYGKQLENLPLLYAALLTIIPFAPYLCDALGLPTVSHSRDLYHVLTTAFTTALPTECFTTAFTTGEGEPSSLRSGGSELIERPKNKH